MSTFDEAKHPRGHATNPGRFSAKQHSAPETALPLGDAWAGIDHGESRLFDRAELADDLLDQLDLVCDDDGNPRVDGTVYLNFREAVPDGEDADAWLQRHSAWIDAWVYAEYGADCTGGDDWEHIPVQFTLTADELGARLPADPDEAAARLAEQTKLVEFHNDLNGAHGSKLSGFWGSLRNAVTREAVPA